MSVTAANDDAEAIAGGGVLNHHLPLRHWPGVEAPFEVMLVKSFNGSWNQDSPAFPARVVDVHHADDCYGRTQAGHDEPMWCFDDAEPGMWHWIVEPAT